MKNKSNDAVQNQKFDSAQKDSVSLLFMHSDQKLLPRSVRHLSPVDLWKIEKQHRTPQSHRKMVL